MKGRKGGESYSSDLTRQMAGRRRVRAGCCFYLSDCPGRGLKHSHFSLAWGAFGQRDNLSKTIKLILLDSLLQVGPIKNIVCVKVQV